MGEVLTSVDSGILRVDQCQSCGSTDVKKLWDFGDSVLAGSFPESTNQVLEKVPMILFKCQNCLLHQISPMLGDQDLFEEYRYVSSIGMQRHFDELASWVISNLPINADSRILEIGSNDGPLMLALRALGFESVGIDPAINICKRAEAKGLTVINDYFGISSVAKYKLQESKDVIISCNSFAHITQINEIARAARETLTAGGFFVIEVQSFEDLVKTGAVDFIYHEHRYYYTLNSIQNLLNRHGFILVKHEKISSHGGSHRLVFQKVEFLNTGEITRSAEFPSDEEVVAAIHKYQLSLERLISKVRDLATEGKRIIGFGASGRANMMLANLPGLEEIIREIYDESPERIGRLTADGRFEISDLKSLKDGEYDVVIIFAWNFFDSISNKWPHTGKVLISALQEDRRANT
jgi:methylation protein EvaC